MRAVRGQSREDGTFLPRTVIHAVLIACRGPQRDRVGRLALQRRSAGSRSTAVFRCRHGQGPAAVAGIGRIGLCDPLIKPMRAVRGQSREDGTFLPRTVIHAVLIACRGPQRDRVGRLALQRRSAGGRDAAFRRRHGQGRAAVAGVGRIGLCDPLIKPMCAVRGQSRKHRVLLPCAVIHAVLIACRGPQRDRVGRLALQRRSAGGRDAAFRRRHGQGRAAVAGVGRIGLCDPLIKPMCAVRGQSRKHRVLLPCAVIHAVLIACRGPQRDRVGRLALQRRSAGSRDAAVFRCRHGQGRAAVAGIGRIGLRNPLIEPMRAVRGQSREGGALLPLTVVHAVFVARCGPQQNGG